MIFAGSGLVNAAAHNLVTSAIGAGQSGLGSGTASNNASGGGGGNVTINISIDGHQFATAIIPSLRTQLLQNKRATVNLGLS